MVVNLNDNITNNLITKSILSPALDLDNNSAVGDGKTQGEVNRKTLLNRVKKMTQADRKEFMGALKELSERINPVAPLPPDTPPLQERGICALILADDGTAAKTHCFIVSFFLGLSNFFGDRVSSAAIMEKIRTTKQALINNGYQLLQANFDPRGDLTTTVGSLQQKLKAPDHSDAIQPIIAQQWAAIKEEFSTASNQKDWSEITTFLNFLGSLIVFKGEINGKVPPETKTVIDRELEAIHEIINCRMKNPSLQGFAASFITSDNLEDLKGQKRFCKARLASWDIRLNQLAFDYNTANPDIKNFKYWEKDLITRVVNLRIRLIENALKSVVSSSVTKKQKIEENIALIQERLKKHEDNISKFQKKEELSENRTTTHRITKKLENLTSICKLVDLLVGKKDKSFNEIKPCLNLAFERISSAPLPLKRINNFGQHLALLNRFANGEDTRQGLADALDLTVLSGHDLIHRLTGFKSNPTGYDFSNDEHKKAFINDYIAYWKIIFDQRKVNKELELKDARDREVQLQTALKQPIELRPQPKLVASGPVIRPQVQQVQPSTPDASLPPLVTIPAGGNATLIAIANGIQNNRSSPSQDVGFYGQLMPGVSLSSDLVGQVYGNFYWIMKDAGKLTDVNPQSGHANHPNWGAEVFTKGIVNGTAPSVVRPLLNHYRTQAIAEVLGGRIRNSPNQF